MHLFVIRILTIKQSNHRNILLIFKNHKQICLLILLGHKSPLRH